MEPGKKIIDQDIARITARIDKNEFCSSSVFVAGGTGLIGRTLVPVFKALGAKVILLVRSEDQARKLFGNDCVYYVGTIQDIPKIDEDIDYIVHTANPTSSFFFVHNPVETMQIAIQGTKNILELAKNKQVRSMVYLSSMEVYGYPQKGHSVKENEVSGFDTRMSRNSYPISKLTCEMMCAAYVHEYSVPAKVIRLTQTFGAGVKYDDGRVFGELMRCAIEKKDIVLHTTGETERCYLYTADAVAAILVVLADGTNRDVYNAANPETYCSIRQMAELVAKIGQISVQYEIDDIQRGYASTLYSMLDTSKLSRLGWKPETGLREMFERMIASQND